MEELISVYLFQNKTCPLPGVGSLSIGDRTASYVLGEKQLHPPLPYISWSPAERSADDFIHYVSVSENITSEEAKRKIDNYCTKIRNLDAYAESEIPFAGKFYIDAEGALVFKQIHFNEAFLPPVPAERIIHPEATHAIIVGDKEINSALMTEYYSEAVPPDKDRWWIWALVITLIAMIAIVMHYQSNSGIGYREKMHSEPEPSTYSQP